MLLIDIPETECWDEARQMFIKTKSAKLQLEHSLLALSKWESIHQKPFLGNKSLTVEETIDYIRCMTINKNVDEEAYAGITNNVLERINKYIESPMTATVVKSVDGAPKGNKNGEFITSELIYYWMVSLQIPFECEKWHLNRLLKLIEVCNAKNQPDRKMSTNDVYAKQKALNESRLKKMRSHRR